LTVLVGSFVLVGIVAAVSVVTLTKNSASTATLSAVSAKERLATKQQRSDATAASRSPSERTRARVATKDPAEPADDGTAREKAERASAERAAQQAAKEKAAREKAAREKAAREKAAREKAAREKAAKEAAKRKAAAEAEKEAAEQKAAREAAKEKAAREKSTPDWVLPLESYVLTGRFGQSGSRWASYHHGLDFAADTGTPIRAVGRGEIIAAGWDGAYGNRILIRHPNGTVTLYGHMSRFERTSGSVEPGTVIGYVGATGNVTGPHLHLEVRPHGGGLDSAIDPYAWLVDKGLHP
jgi:murein DD-endopeptidase MepM/ murein hydrolase activator NlpD